MTGIAFSRKLMCRWLGIRTLRRTQWRWLAPVACRPCRRQRLRVGHDFCKIRRPLNAARSFHTELVGSLIPSPRTMFSQVSGAHSLRTVVQDHSRGLNAVLEFRSVELGLTLAEVYTGADVSMAMAVLEQHWASELQCRPGRRRSCAPMGPLRAELPVKTGKQRITPLLNRRHWSCCCCCHRHRACHWSQLSHRGVPSRRLRLRRRGRRRS